MTKSAFFQPARPWRPLFLFGLMGAAAPALAGACSGCLFAEPPTPDHPFDSSQDFRVQGEFGLAVHIDEDAIEVRWLTGVPEEGRLDVIEEGTVTHSVRTDRWSSHFARFPIPAGRDFILEYGSSEADGERFQTRIRLDAARERDPVRIAGVDSLLVVGDVHGEFDKLVGVLRNAGLVDESLTWTGGTRHLVALGDMMSRGMDVAAVLWLLYRLEAEALEAGGRVHVMLGNHEIMVMLRDLRYVHPKEQWIAESYEVSYDRLYDTRRSVLGRWLASKPGILQIGDVLLAHGGISAANLEFTPESYSDSLATFMGEELFHRWADTTYVPPISRTAFERRFDFFWDSTSVFWHRGYGLGEAEEEELESVLQAFGAALHVVGHTPVPGIREAYDGRLLMTNTQPFAEEILLLARDPEAPAGWARMRFGQSGPPMPLIQGHPPEGD